MMAAKMLLGLRLLSLLLLPAACTARAILGVDLGSLYMKVALVQSGSPLEIVTNLHSKRKTEQMVLFDRSQRFYGADASALLARKSHQTPQAMTVLLGRDDQHPVVQVLSERHYPLRPVYNDTVKGVVLTVDGVDFTPEELVAMVLSHAVDISVAYSLESGSPIPPPTDCVLTVSCYATQQERRALLDAAALADLNVLTLVEENTAAALQYAMDKTFTDGEELILFYNMGASALQVSLVRFFSYEPPVKGYAKPKSAPGFEVLAKAWDDTCGGLAFDHLIVEHLADEFNQQYEKARGKTTDVRNDPRAMTKLRIQANKIKHVLSANTEMPVYMEGIHDDVALKTTVTRTQMEALSSSLLKRATAPVQLVLERANKTLQELTAIELIGGGMRIPRVQAELSKAVGGMDLGMHINADESMALGAAFAGANISTAFRVRHVGMTDVNPFAMNVTLSDIAVDDVAAKEGEEEEPWMKQATIFKALGKMGVKKTIAFTHDKDVHCSLDYQDNDMLPSGTELSIERYNVTGVVAFAKEMEEKGLGKPKVSLQFELNPSGITALVKAEAAVEETYTVEEEVEVDEEVDANATDADSANATDTDSANATDTDSANATAAANATEGADNATKAEAKNATKAEKKPKKTIMVEKEKKKVHKRALTVKAYHVGRVQPHTPELITASKAKLLELAQSDKERMMLEESKNRVESYIYRIKNKLTDDEEAIAKVSTEKQRAECQKLAEDAEEWLYDDGYNADLATMEDKYAELSVPFEKIQLRVDEETARPEAVEKLKSKLTEVEALMTKWETTMPQVTKEEIAKVTVKVKEATTWLEKREKEQSKKKPHQEPAFTSADIPPQFEPVESLVVRLSRKPKPKPEKKKANATQTNATDANATETNATDANATEASASETNATDANATKEDESGETAESTSEASKEEVDDEL